MPRLSVSLLGTFQVLLADKPVTTFESDKVRALLAYLAVESGWPHRRQTLAGLLWPERPDRNARQNLSQALFNLRRAIGDRQASPPFLLITPQTLQFNQASDYELDTALFTELLAAVKEHPHRRLRECETCLVRLQRAVTLFRGEFLAGFSVENSLAFEEWSLLERERYHRLLVDALRRLAEAYRQRGEYEAALLYARRWVGLEPWQEEAHRQVMRLLAYAGQYNAALAQYESCRLTLAEELSIEPSVELQTLKARIQAARDGRRHTFRPPFEPVLLIGREKELAQIARLLADPNCRLLTLIGPGGIGKTRIALEVLAGQTQGGEFLEGVCFVPLDSVSSPDLIVAAVANALQLPLQGAVDPKRQLFNYLDDQEILLALDSFEHLLSPLGEDDRTDPPSKSRMDGAELLVEILAAAPRLKLLVTSRERLNLRGEWLLDIQGLSYPPKEGNGVERIADYSALQLFMENVRRIQPDFSEAGQVAEGAAYICRLVEGLPLAIELAAAWAREFTYREIAREIEQGLAFLTTSVRDMPDRHRSVQVVFDHSWRLLLEEEQTVFQQLSVFRGGFRLEAAQQVAGATPPLLATLVDKSFLRRDESERYTTHNLIRRYAEEKLQGSPQEEEAVKERHCDYYMAFLQQRELAGGGDLLQMIGQLGEEIDNIRTGWRWAIGQAQVAALEKGLSGLWSFYEIRGWFREGEETFRRAVERLTALADPAQDNKTVLGQLLARQGWFCWRLSRYRQSRELFEQGLALLGETHPEVRPERGFILRQLGLVAWNLGDYAQAKQLLQEGQAIAAEFGDGFGVILGLFYRGLVELSLGDYPQARQLFQEALALSTEQNEQRGVAHWQIGLGWAAYAMGEYEEANQLLQKSLAICRETQDMVGIPFGLNNLGAVAYLQGDYQTAGHYFQESLDIVKKTGDLSGMGQALNGLGNVAAGLGDYQTSGSYFREAIEMAIEAELLPVVIEALLGLARLLTTSGRSDDQPVELLALALHHPAGSRATKDGATQLLAQLQPHLSPEHVQLVQSGKQARDLGIVTGEILEAGYVSF